MGTVPKQSRGLACIPRGTIMATAAITKAMPDCDNCGVSTPAVGTHPVLLNPLAITKSDDGVKPEDDTLSSSPDLAAIRSMGAEELHREIIQTYVALGENVVAYQALVLD